MLQDKPHQGFETQADLDQVSSFIRSFNKAEHGFLGGIIGKCTPIANTGGQVWVGDGSLTPPTGSLPSVTTLVASIPLGMVKYASLPGGPSNLLTVKLIKAVIQAKLEIENKDSALLIRASSGSDGKAMLEYANTTEEAFADKLRAMRAESKGSVAAVNPKDPSGPKV